MLALMGGAKGIAWYSYGDNVGPNIGLRESPSQWAYMKKLNRDLRGLTDILDGDVIADPVIFPPNGVIGKCIKKNNRIYIFIANVDNAPKTLAITHNSIKAGDKLTVHGEFRSLLTAKGQNNKVGVADLFGCYCVYVYVK